jgi:4-amino-4-deoxy-L-arabinose transferase-like glycosyltransferase
VRGWSPYAWGAAGIAASFIALTCWWLTQDRSIPIYDAGDHLWAALYYHNLIKSGDLLGPFNYTWQYPPLGHLVGALAAFIGGVNVASPIIGENLVFVSLLTLGCYRAGRLLFGSLAGMLATLFVLGSPLLIAQFHVFMLDAPETALVAVSIWLILATRQFSRTGTSALAGLVVGLGLLVKVQFPFFIVGIVACALLLGGWRNRRGFVLFAVVAFLVGSPWYIHHISELSNISRLGGGASSGATAANAPPLLSGAQLSWYLWSILNSQLLAPLSLLVLVGGAWMGVALVRLRGVIPKARIEFLAGGFVAWLSITLTPHHDTRYGMPMLPYLAILGTGWIVAAPRAARRVAIAVIVFAVLANTLGTTFGAGGEVQLGLVHPLPADSSSTDRIKLYSNTGFLVSGPHRDGNVPAMLVALRENGVRTVAWNLQDSRGPDYDFEGLVPLALIAKLKYVATSVPESSNAVDVAALVHRPVVAHKPPPCAKLDDGTGVFVLRYSRPRRKLMLYCPSHNPRYVPIPAEATAAG